MNTPGQDVPFVLLPHYLTHVLVNETCMLWSQIMNLRHTICFLYIQGEDVVAGIRTPEDLDAMKDVMPQAYEELVENCNILESHYKEMQVH